MRRNANRAKLPMKRMLLRLTALMMVLCLLPLGALAENEGDDWVTFFLLCNEGMTNAGGNSGNTMMVVGMNPNSGKIRLLVFMWDTFVQYEGYDVPQRIGMPYRNNGPEETLEVFNTNFGMDIDLFMSLNYLNLASLIDTFGGVEVDVSRAERNALNGMVGSKEERLKAQADSGLLSQAVVEMLANEYYLNEYGPDTHLNGLQAVGFGWLQYDSVYNCCLRALEVIADLFSSVGDSIAEKVVLYSNEYDLPEDIGSRRPINLDEMTEEDIDFLRELVSPIFEKSYNNLSDEDIVGISTTLMKAAYDASRQGYDIFSAVDRTILPLEAMNEYDIVAGTKGHLVDAEANGEAMRAFLFAEDEG